MSNKISHNPKQVENFLSRFFGFLICILGIAWLLTVNFFLPVIKMDFKSMQEENDLDGKMVTLFQDLLQNNKEDNNDFQEYSDFEYFELDGWFKKHVFSATLSIQQFDHSASKSFIKKSKEPQILIDQIKSTSIDVKTDNKRHYKFKLPIALIIADLYPAFVDDMYSFHMKNKNFTQCRLRMRDKGIISVHVKTIDIEKKIKCLYKPEDSKQENRAAWNKIVVNLDKVREIAKEEDFYYRIKDKLELKIVDAGKKYKNLN